MNTLKFEEIKPSNLSGYILEISYRPIKSYDELVTVVGSLWDSNKLNMRVVEERYRRYLEEMWVR